MAEFLERPQSIAHLVNTHVWTEIDINPYINMGYIPSTATGLIISVRSYGTGEYGFRVPGSCRKTTGIASEIISASGVAAEKTSGIATHNFLPDITSGTATGGSATKLIDTTKNFVAVGVIVGHVVYRVADGKTGTITSITTTTNPNDTLNYAGAYMDPTFGGGDLYRVLPTNDRLVDTTKNFLTLGVIAGQVLFRVANWTYRLVASLATTVNPNDTIVFASRYTTPKPFFNIGDSYQVMYGLAKLVDPTKNFTVLGVVGAGQHYIFRESDWTYGAIASISTTVNPNDTINYSGGTLGIFHSGDNYQITYGIARLYDPTKNFTALGVVVGDEVYKDVDKKWGTISAIVSRGAGINNTLEFSETYPPIFHDGDNYHVTYKFKESINAGSGEMFYVGMSDDKKIDVYFDGGGYGTYIEIAGYFDCEGVMFDEPRLISGNKEAYKLYLTQIDDEVKVVNSETMSIINTIPVTGHNHLAYYAHDRVRKKIFYCSWSYLWIDVIDTNTDTLIGTINLDPSIFIACQGGMEVDEENGFLYVNVEAHAPSQPTLQQAAIVKIDINTLTVVDYIIYDLWGLHWPADNCYPTQGPMTIMGDKLFVAGIGRNPSLPSGFTPVARIMIDLTSFTKAGYTWWQPSGIYPSGASVYASHRLVNKEETYFYWIIDVEITPKYYTTLVQFDSGGNWISQSYVEGLGYNGASAIDAQKKFIYAVHSNPTTSYAETIKWNLTITSPVVVGTATVLSGSSYCKGGFFNKTNNKFYLTSHSDQKLYRVTTEPSLATDATTVTFVSRPYTITGVPYSTGITNPGENCWLTYDLSPYVTTIAKAAFFIKCSANDYGVAPKFGVRKYGSSYNNKSLCNEIFGFIAPLDENRKCEMYYSNTYSSKFYLVGFMVTGVFKDTPQQIFPMRSYTNGAATGGASNKLIDTTKNFYTITGSMSPGSVLYRLADGKYVISSGALTTTVATQIVSGTCNNTPSYEYSKLTDTTKNFIALGVIPGHFIFQDDTHYAVITDVDTTVLHYEVSNVTPLSPAFINGIAYTVWTGNKYDTINYTGGGTAPTFGAGDLYELRKSSSAYYDWTDIDLISDPDLPQYTRGVIYHVFNNVSPGSWTHGGLRQRPQGTYTIEHVLGTDGNVYRCQKSHISSPATRPITGASFNTYWISEGAPPTGYNVLIWQDNHHYECWTAETRWGELNTTHGSSILASGMRRDLGVTATYNPDIPGYNSIDVYGAFVDAYGDLYFADLAYEIGAVYRIRNYAGTSWKSGEQELVAVIVNPFSDHFYPTGRCFGAADPGSDNKKLIDSSKNFNTVAGPYGVINKRIYKVSDGTNARITSISTTFYPYDTIHWIEHHGDPRYAESPVFSGGDDYEIKAPSGTHIGGMFDDSNDPDGFFYVGGPYTVPYTNYTPWTTYWHYTVGTTCQYGTGSYRCIVDHYAVNFLAEYAAGFWATPAEGGCPLFRVDKNTGSQDLWYHQNSMPGPESGNIAFNAKDDAVLFYSTWSNWPVTPIHPGFVEIPRGALHWQTVWWTSPAVGSYSNIGCFSDGRISAAAPSMGIMVLISKFGLGGVVIQTCTTSFGTGTGFNQSTVDNINNRVFMCGAGLSGISYCWDLLSNTVKSIITSDIGGYGGRGIGFNHNDGWVYETRASFHRRFNWDTGVVETWDGDIGLGGGYGYTGYGGTYFKREEPTIHVVQGFNVSPGEEFWVMGYFEPCMIPEPASNPDPFVGEDCVPIDKVLNWDSGMYTTSHDVYFGKIYPPPFVGNQILDNYDPGTLNYDTVYYWRIDEVNIYGTTVGPDWNFRTAVQPPAKASNPDPFDEEANVLPTRVLSWTSSPEAIRHAVHFDTTSNPEFKLIQTGTTYDHDPPGTLELNTYYYWRIDEIDICDTTTVGDEWIFLTYPGFEDLQVIIDADVELEEIFFKNEIIFSFDNEVAPIDTYCNLAIRGKQLSGLPNTFPVMVAIKLCDQWFILQPSYVCDYFVLTPTYFTFPNTWKTLYWEHIFSTKLTRDQVISAKIAIIPRDDLILHSLAISEIKLFSIEPTYELFDIKLDGWSIHDTQHDDMIKTYVKVYKKDVGGYGAGIYSFGLFGT
jgi:hypothetical protein